MSAHGLLSKDELRAITWVRRHGGIDEVEHKVAASMETADEYANLQCAIAERCGDLFEMLKLEDDELIAMLDKRLMPEGYEWPRFEGGEPVHIGDEFEKAGKRMTVMAVHFSAASCYLCAGGHGEHYVANGELVKRPAPKVLDADGVEIRAGDECYVVSNGDGPYVVDRIRETDGAIDMYWHENKNESLHIRPDLITHRAPVLAADGRPLREGETVWGIGREQHEYVVLGQPGLGGGTGRFKVVCHDVTNDIDCDCDPSLLTHERPEVDSWERLEEDAKQLDIDLNDTTDDYPRMSCCRDLVRRARALAGSDR